MKYTEKSDAAYDKKNGIKEGSKKDNALDKKRGLPTEKQSKAETKNKGKK